MAKNKVTEKTNLIDDKIRNLKDFLGAEVGYLRETTGPQTYDNGLTLAGNAVIQEYGASRDFGNGKQPHIPPRPFMREGADRFEKSKRAIGKIVADVGEGSKSAKTGSNALGVMLQTHIRRAIRDGNWEANAPATVAKKGSSKPLIDTGKLRQGVDVRTK